MFEGSFMLRDDEQRRQRLSHGGLAILRVSHSSNRRIYHRGHRRVSFIQKKKEKNTLSLTFHGRLPFDGRFFDHCVAALKRIKDSSTQATSYNSTR